MSGLEAALSVSRIALLENRIAHMIDNVSCRQADRTGPFRPIAPQITPSTATDIETNLLILEYRRSALIEYFNEVQSVRSENAVRIHGPMDALNNITLKISVPVSPLPSYRVIGASIATLIGLNYLDLPSYASLGAASALSIASVALLKNKRKWILRNIETVNLETQFTGVSRALIPTSVLNEGQKSAVALSNGVKELLVQMIAIIPETSRGKSHEVLSSHGISLE
jgi:hypothetical protein